MGSKKLKTVVGVFGLVLLFAYQNCAKVSSSSSAKAVDNSVSSDGGVVSTMPVSTTGTLDDVVSKLGQDESKHAEALALCANSKLEISQSLVSQNFKGILGIQTDYVKEVSDLSGSLTVKSNSASGRIDLISNITANSLSSNRALVLCDFQDVASLKNIIGQIILVNSHVTALDGHSGQILLVNSKIDKITNQEGEVLNLVSLD
ncbi:MAG: hypothetical protein H7256_05460 [Bdellovibrio sp.]|nr:hypothetical protein [Bdellovibrio sp.]